VGAVGDRPLDGAADTGDKQILLVSILHRGSKLDGGHGTAHTGSVVLLQGVVPEKIQCVHLAEMEVSVGEALGNKTSGSINPGARGRNRGLRGNRRLRPFGTDTVGAGT
jgi:hypothetical protein